MPGKTKEAQLAAQRKYYQKNKAKVIKINAEHRKKQREAWQEFKATLKCAVCGENHPAVLDFHHVDPTQKDSAVFNFIRNGAYKKAREEIKKCVVLCANHHRIYHHEERITKKLAQS